VPQQSIHGFLNHKIRHTAYVSGYQPYCALLQDYSRNKSLSPLVMNDCFYTGNVQTLILQLILFWFHWFGVNHSLVPPNLISPLGTDLILFQGTTITNFLHIYHVGCDSLSGIESKNVACLNVPFTWREGVRHFPFITSR
jgi:hypothetical protein